MGLSEISLDWLVGFIEGEGNFHIILSYSHKAGKKLHICYPILQFRIFLREDDLDVLKKIEQFIGCGKIYKKNYDYARRKGVGARDQYCFVISDVKGLTHLKDILQNSNFHTKKNKDKDIFFDILEMIKQKNHLTKEGNEKIIQLANKMNSQNRALFRKKPV